ncbi:MAG: NAD(P)H-dependent oxidoreductase [Spirochaetota bacterium]|nr:NAD(P)H-dependent oxidoreductase [Spirochaetota bacterium]
MKITVLNGSPKGMTSVTMQYIHYIQKAFPTHKLNIINISQDIKRIEMGNQIFDDILNEIESSDGILWAFPVYFYLVPANYKRFIELIMERGAKEVFRNRYTACISTSIHFFDHTAHNYMHAICDDLNMKYLGSFSADMYDLEIPKETETLCMFIENFFYSIKNNITTSKRFSPLSMQDFYYTPGNVNEILDSGANKIIIISDHLDHQYNLIKMIERFKASFTNEIEVINLRELDIKRSCMGCINCGYDNKCVYEYKDEFIDFFNTKIMTADILIWAGAIKDRYLSAKWKTFFDRSFFYGHVPVLKGKQIGFIISGPLSQIPNLRQIMEAYVDNQHANIVDFVTDEFGDSAEIDSLLNNLGKRSIRFANSGYISPHTFLSEGGAKILRDNIWGRFRFPIRADYLFFKRHGMFDFPQKEYKIRILNKIMLFLSKSPKYRKEVNKRMKNEMIKPLQKVLDKITL